ncbi:MULTISPECIES: adenine phosphoribosyltransferase [unclassified Adlercreutzia]|uniref:adenine phosphoribosyltransferase n=1 Tax=unclassified Adlercreutzia TaxID=2636013 RepID=UPI0013ED829D|nr:MULTISPECIES: adenine phosphoribosyltransferase [unclassified Adlercreutzia]
MTTPVTDSAAAADTATAPAASTTAATDFDFESLIVSIPDYPEPGVVFKDITPLLADAEGFAAVVDAISGHFANRGITKVVCAEARGFMVGAPVARALGAGFVPARKPGKLPRESICESFELEYGTDELHIHTDALTADDVVLIVDDLVATGGTANAQVRLIERCGAKLAGMGFLMELAFLNPRATIATATDVEVFSLVQVK